MSHRGRARTCDLSFKTTSTLPSELLCVGLSGCVRYNHIYKDIEPVTICYVDKRSTSKLSREI